uniref:Uncharacterized protein n=1 Tax=Amphimedon queenslandica TaxID=400682 RepID=A0A1X7SX43_AMPQE
MDSGLVVMPGYTEIPANTRKVPLPPIPVEEE